MSTETKYNVRKKLKIFIICSIIVCGSIGMTQAQNSIIISASDSTARARTLYKIEFIPTENLGREAELKIVFPREFILTKKILAGSRALNGGLVAFVKGDTVLVQRTGLGTEVPAGTKVDVMLSDIINPVRADKEYQISVKIKNEHMSTSIKTAQVPMTIKPRAVSR
jgi:hypothetical protein